MTKSDRPSFSDVREAYRLIGAIRDMAYDSELWHARLMGGLRELLHAQTAVGGEWRWQHPERGPQVRQLVKVGLTPRMAALHGAYLEKKGYAADPFYTALRRREGASAVTVFCRRDLLDDSEWYDSGIFRLFFGPSGLDHVLGSIYRYASDGRRNVFAVRRLAGARPFSSRDKRLARLLHHELGLLIGPVLATVDEPGLRRLPPRQRQALEGLVRGWGEKRIAGWMGIAPSTLHPYISQLYDHFKVSGRAELMAQYLGRNCLAAPDLTGCPPRKRSKGKDWGDC